MGNLLLTLDGKTSLCDRFGAVLCVVTPMLIVSYYSVVGGWSLHYLLKSFSLDFVRHAAEAEKGSFGAFISHPWMPLACFLVYLGTACAIVATGVKKGIELFSKVSIPILFVLVLLIVIYSVSLPGARAGVTYLVRPDFSAVTGKTFLDALGQSFYSLSLGMGIMITYGSYVRKEEDPVASGLGTAFADLGFALMAGFAVMPAVFAAGIAPSAGPGLIFDTVPFIFGKMGETWPVISSIVAIFFFFSILVAALTSTVSLIEVGVAYLTEERRMRRGRACVVAFLFTAVIGALCSLSFGPLSGFRLAGEPIFNFLDKFCSNFLLTLGGLLCVIFVGWKMKRSDVRDELTNGGTLKRNDRIFGVVYFLIKYLAPLAVAIIFISNFL